MRLSRDTSGTFKQAKDSLQRDLITLQRNFDQTQQQATTALTSIAGIRRQLAENELTVAANGQVTTGGAGLQVVAHDATLFGKGTAASPLRVNSDYVSSPILVASYPFNAVAAITGLGTTYAGGTTLVSPASGFSVAVIAWSAQLTKNAQAWTAAPTFRLLNNSVGNLIAGDIGITNAANAGEYGGINYGTARNWGANVANNDPNGQALKLITTAVVTPNLVTVSQGNIVVWYVLQPSS